MLQLLESAAVTTVKLNKIASATSTLPLDRACAIGTTIPSEGGTVLIVEALEDKTVYGELELVGGRMARIIKGDLIAAVLGERQALKGYVGVIPPHIAPGDVLHMLNMGGVVGRCVSANPDLGKPLRVRVVGVALLDGAPANIRQGAIAWKDTLPTSAPLIVISGTCMNSGKTTTACEILRQLSAKGYRMAAAKVAGVATQRDLYNMLDHGAVTGLTFSDAGLASTVQNLDAVVPAAKGILAALNDHHPDAIMVELGDGIMGHYGVDLLLKDAELMGHMKAHVLCANDLVGAWGGLQFLRSLDLPVDCVAGPATDNSAGVAYIEQHFGALAVNARTDPAQLGRLIERKVFTV
jgi:hypothetical protein